jgi:glycosyltransferase involved in cell wall biosynthesis
LKPPQRNNFFIQEHLHRENLVHGGVGNKDIERLLIKMGFTPIAFPCHFEFSLKAKWARLIHLFRMVATLPSKSTVVFQFPLYARMHKILVRLLRRFRPTIKIICFLTDINGLKDGDPALLKKELLFIRLFENIIVHNQAMATWLVQQQHGAKLAMIEFFDFPVEVNLQKRQKAPSIAFAGYLDKSKFVTAVTQLSAVDFHVYGPTDTLALPTTANIFYHGIYTPESLPQQLKGSFGLVWDGDSIDGLQGIFGEYNRYISPHKLSLYLLAGMPVIAHSASGAAEIIRKYQIGFTINNLSEMHDIITTMSEEEYQTMRRNCLPLAERIAKGDCLRNALLDLGVGFST